MICIYFWQYSNDFYFNQLEYFSKLCICLHLLVPTYQQTALWEHHGQLPLQQERWGNRAEQLQNGGWLPTGIPAFSL